MGKSLARFLSSPKKPKQLLAILLFLTLLLYVLIASYKLRYPGTMYDEALYVNAALGGVDKVTFFTKSFHNFPILLMPYIGALKSYIFFPIFAVFGVTPVSMRLPDVLITGIALYLMYVLLRKRASKGLSLLVVMITALNASFIVFTRLDNGPVVLDFLIKIVGLIFLLKFLEQNRMRFLVLYWVSMLLGEFNKLNFVWYANAFTAAFILIYGLRIWSKSKRTVRIRLLSITVLGYAACVAYYLYITRYYHIVSSFGFIGWKTFYGLLSTLVDGSWFYNYALSPNETSSTIIFWLQTAIILSGATIVIWHIYKHRSFKDRFYTFYAFIALCLLLLLGEIALTRQATAGWHYFSIFPLFGVLVVLSLYILLKRGLSLKHNLTLAIEGLIIALFCIQQLFVYGQYIDLYGKTPYNLIWSNAIYSLANYTKAHKNAEFVSLDWGTQTQLLGFDPMHNKYYEVFGPIAVNGSAMSISTYREYIANLQNAYYITHTSKAEIDPEVETDFFRLAKLHSYTPVLVKIVKDHSTSVFYIYKLRK